MMPKRAYYYLSYQQLTEAKKPAEWWNSHGILPLVLIPRQDTVLYDGATEPGTLEVVARTIGTLCPAGWLAGFWACNNLRHTTLMPWADDTAFGTFLQRLAWLSASVQAHGGAGVVCDGEDYQHALNQHTQTGPMNPVTAWPPHPRIQERARQTSRCVAGQFGVMVASSEFGRVPGLQVFWRAVGKARGKQDFMLFAEDYTKGIDHAAGDRIGARYVPGFAEVKDAREHGVAWVYDQKLIFLKNH